MYPRSVVASSWTASRAAIIHVPVVQLNVPAAWRVGRVTFQPGGWLAGHTQPEPAGDDEPMKAFLKLARKGIEEHQTSTAAVRVRWPEKNTQPTLDAAVDDVRDSVAVLRLYQHARYPMMNTDIQQFGIHGDIGATVQTYAVTQGERILAHGVHWLGVIGNWEFTSADVRDFRADPRFRYLDATLRTPPSRRSEFQRRVLTAVRTLGFATPMVREQLRVVLLATALEALLAADVQPGGRSELGEFFRITQRAAYLLCGEPDQRYPSRPPCPYLHAQTLPALRHALDDRVKRGERPACSYFWHIFDLFDDRNSALHRTREHFDRSRLSWHRIYTEKVILYAVEWANAHSGVGLASLQAEFAALVSGGRAITG